MPTGDLGPEVEPPVARVDLPPPQRQRVSPAYVHARLAAGGQAVPRVGDESELALAEEAGRVAEGLDRATEARLEVGFRLRDLPPRFGVAEQQQIRVRDGVRLEAQGPRPVELHNLLPGQKRRLVGVPGKRRRPVDHPRRDEDSRAEAE